MPHSYGRNRGCATELGAENAGLHYISLHPGISQFADANAAGPEKKAANVKTEGECKLSGGESRLSEK